MEKLIITCTVDCTRSYSGSKYMIPMQQVEKSAQEYIGAVKHGAAIVHHHGVRYLEPEIQPDGRQFSKIDFEGWRKLTALIREEVDPVMQFGIAAARIPDKVKLMGPEYSPDMMSYSFNAHDEHFEPAGPGGEAADIYGMHPRAELVEFCTEAAKHGVKPEVEAFHPGALWNLQHLRSKGLPIGDHPYITLLVGWPGGAWTPPDPETFLNFVRHVPADCTWNLSVLNPAHWQLISLAIAIGGHVRVGWEDYPYLPNGEPGPHLSDFVDVAVSMAKNVGREIATPEEARKIIGLRARSAKKTTV